LAGAVSQTPLSIGALATTSAALVTVKVGAPSAAAAY
jgi:hypothetical protein